MARHLAGDFEPAIRLYRKALEINPSYLQSHNNLATLLYRKGEIEEAAAHCHAALRIDPCCLHALAILATIADGKGDAMAAIGFRRRRLELQPDDVETLGLLAWNLATYPDAAVRNGTEAVALAQRAVQLTGAGDPTILDVLAAAYAETGRFPDALATVGKALELATAQKNGALADVLRARMQAYRLGHPCRQTPLRPAIAP